MENESEFAPPNSKQEALGFDSEHLLRTENIPFDVSVKCSVTILSGADLGSCLARLNLLEVTHAHSDR